LGITLLGFFAAAWVLLLGKRMVQKALGYDGSGHGPSDYTRVSVAADAADAPAEPAASAAPDATAEPAAEAGAEAPAEAATDTPTTDAPAAAQDDPTPPVAETTDTAAEPTAAEAPEPGPEAAAADGGDAADEPEPEPAAPESPKRQPKKTRANPLDFNWAFGFDCSTIGGVHYFSDSTREDIFYFSGNTGVLYDRQSNEQTLLQGHRNAITCACASEDKRWLATSDLGPDATVIVWDSSTGAPVRAIFDEHLNGGAHAMAFSTDGTLLATVGGESGEHVAVFDWAAPDIEAPILQTTLDSAQTGKQTQIQFEMDSNRRMIATGADKIVLIQWDDKGKVQWTVPSMGSVTRPKNAGACVQSMSLPDSNLIVTTTLGGYVVVWRYTDNGEAVCVKFIHLTDAGITCALYTPDRKTFVAGCADGCLRYYDLTFKMVGWNDQIGKSGITSISFETQSVEDNMLSETQRIKLGLERLPLVIPDYIVCTQKGSVFRAGAQGDTEVAEHLFRGQNAEVHAIAAHPSEGTLAMAGYSGYLQLWNYQARTILGSTQFDDGLLPHSMAFSADGNVLVVGFTNGTVHVLEALSLQLLTPQMKFREGDECVQKIVVSECGTYFATMDGDRCVALYKEQPDNTQEPWFFVGKNQSHYRDVVDIMFGVDDKDQPRLLSLGVDRMLVEHDLQGSGFFEGFQVKGAAVRTEQSAYPQAMAWCPETAHAEKMIVTSNSDFKFKLLNQTTKMCRKTVLGPTYEEPIKRMAVLPAYPKPDSERLLAYTTGDKVGLALMPLDGNPHRGMVLIGQAGGVTNLATSFDGRYIFTSGGNNVHMWAVNGDVLAAHAKLGGEGLAPFVGLIEGGREGDLFKEMEEYFYYAQLRFQGISTMKSRKVSECLPLSEVPRVMRALGFYPSERDIQDITNEIKLSEYLQTGKYVTEVNLPTFIKLFVNHRPAFGMPKGQLDEAFAQLTSDDPDAEGYIETAELYRLVQNHGEHISDNELSNIFGVLLGDNMPSQPKEMNAQYFATDILGFS